MSQVFFFVYSSLENDIHGKLSCFFIGDKMTQELMIEVFVDIWLI